MACGVGVVSAGGVSHWGTNQEEGMRSPWWSPARRVTAKGPRRGCCGQRPETGRRGADAVARRAASVSAGRGNPVTPQAHCNVVLLPCAHPWGSGEDTGRVPGEGGPNPIRVTFTAGAGLGTSLALD